MRDPDFSLVQGKKDETRGQKDKRRREKIKLKKRRKIMQSRILKRFTLLMLSVLLVGAFVATGVPALADRVPAEWEAQEAVWLQWPKWIEKALRNGMADIIDAIEDYVPVRLLCHNSDDRSNAQKKLSGCTNVTYYIMKHDWCWMRDNGPVWVEDASSDLYVQDWGFDCWGCNFEPPCTWEKDDAVPCKVAALEGVDCVSYDLILEGGNIEFNGSDALLVSWSVQEDRNPESKAVQEQMFKDAFGVTDVVWTLHGPPDDLTGGHIDGIARFLPNGNVTVNRYVDQEAPDAWIYEEAADIIEAAGFTVVRLDIPGYVRYKGNDWACNYMNYLVTNGAVIMCGFDGGEWDAAAKATMEGYFPGRTVVVVDTLAFWNDGGGIHCITCPQPE